MRTFHCVNFGCRASQADGAALKQQLVNAGFAQVDALSGSELAILNTCTVTASADAEVRQVIRRIHRENPDCRILVTGCYAQRAPREIAQLPGVAWVVGNSHKHTVANLLKSAVGEATDGNGSSRGHSQRFDSSAHSLIQLQGRSAGPAQIIVGGITDAFHFAPSFPDDRTRPTLKIQDGCDARCSFCVIPSVRGDSRSLDAETVIGQIRELESRGAKEVVLSGINLGSYGKDLIPRTSFLELLARVLSEAGIARIRISSIEPMDVTPDLIAFVAGDPRMALHFHVPLQSGCDRILRLMNRRYWTAQYAERIAVIRDQVPNCAIGADVMAGFPGETPDDHAASREFIELLPFTYLHVFPYSARPGTPAAGRPQQVDGRVVHERSRELLAIGAHKRREFMAAQAGRTLSVLTLDETSHGERVALSSNYLKVLLPLAGHPANRLFEVEIDRARDNFLIGRVEGC